MREVTFYIGDVHGMAALLKRLLQFIEDYCAKNECVPKVVLLGDLVDRGPHSRTVLDIVMRVIERWPGSETLLGNHDDIFLQMMQLKSYPDAAYEWIQSEGGSATCQSYANIDSFQYVTGYIRDNFQHHLDLLRSAKLMHRSGKFIASHAGINPYIDLDKQEKDDLLWIRELFLNHVKLHNSVVIHGHSIENELPTVTESRISLDTGAFETGRLTALLVDDHFKALRFYQTAANGVDEVEPVILDRGLGSIFDRLPVFFSQ